MNVYIIHSHLLNIAKKFGALIRSVIYHNIKSNILGPRSISQKLKLLSRTI